MRRAVIIFLVPFIIAIIGSFLIFFTSFIPSSFIKDMSLQSAAELSQKPDYSMGNNRTAYVMDYYTDSLILMESYTLSSSEPVTVLTNPMLYNESLSCDRLLAEAVNGAELNVNYVRFWMGFRIVVRPLLLLFSYDSICWLSSLAFFTAAFILIAMIARLCSLSAAFCFGLALALVNPAVIAHSLQFYCCFMLSFMFMIFLLLKRNCRISYSLCFCCFGALTQFFDFYTTPLICFALPFLLLVEMDSIGEHRFLSLLKYFFLWFYGYVGIWLIKLFAVTIFTDINGFADGLTSLKGRLGLSIVPGIEQYYSVPYALHRIWGTVFPGATSKPALFGFLAAFIISLVLSLKKTASFSLSSSLIYPAVSLLVIIWYSVSAQPSSIHAWFQYRSLIVLFFSQFLFAFKTLRHLRNPGPV